MINIWAAYQSSVPKPNGVVRRSQSFLQTISLQIQLEDQAKKDFHSDRAASNTIVTNISNK
ncbi:hypothetical protein AXA65_13550 [Chryseobacterium sp. FP211-J200]|nr:hypothetical protein AXA65_13550 [Chryseobacterium sp. FP211-J200]